MLRFCLGSFVLPRRPIVVQLFCGEADVIRSCVSSAVKLKMIYKRETRDIQNQVALWRIDKVNMLLDRDFPLQGSLVKSPRSCRATTTNGVLTGMKSTYPHHTTDVLLNKKTPRFTD
jgi:hypothetical protein